MQPLHARIGSGEEAEAETGTLPLQAQPAGYLIGHHPPEAPTLTIVTLEWDRGMQHLCRLCPAALCGVSPRGTCTRVIPAILSGREAVFYLHPGSR